MTSETAPHTYQDLLLFLGTAAVIVPLFGRLKMSPVLGFLAAGVLLGPFGLGALAHTVPWLSAVAFTDTSEIANFGEFGIAFLLFMIGLELSWERLVRMRKLVFGLGPLQVILSAAAIGLAAYALGETPASAAVLGTALALSSTAIVLPSLSERKQLTTTAGRASFAVLLFQDLAVAPFLLLIALLGKWHGMGVGTGLATVSVLVSAILGLAALVALGRLVLRPLFHLVAETRNNEFFVAACFLVVFGTGTFAVAIGQSMTLGAFIAGLLLAETEYRRQIEMTVQMFQGLLLGLFFVSVGARLDLSQIVARPALVLGITGGIVALKMIVLYPLARAFGLPSNVARDTSLVLGPGGEFALIAIGAAMAAQVVPGPAGALAMITATLSMFTIPLFVRLSERLAHHTAATDPALCTLIAHSQENPPKVIIVGYGRVGQLVGQMLTRHNVSYLAIDGNPALVTRERNGGTQIFYGDATRIELLRLCGIASATALVVTMDMPASVEAVVRAARAERSELIIVARARDATHAAKLYGLHVTDAVPETIEASLQLSEAVLVDIGVPMGLVIASVHETRDEFRKLLQNPTNEGRPRFAIRASTREIETPDRERE